MIYEFDNSKNKSNFDKHGLYLTESHDFEWDTAVISEDVRKQYPEQRFEAIGYINVRLYVMIYCLRGDVVRVISLRKANNREEKIYAKT
jgi:uncharacterized protein